MYVAGKRKVIISKKILNVSCLMLKVYVDCIVEIV